MHCKQLSFPPSLVDIIQLEGKALGHQEVVALTWYGNNIIFVVVCFGFSLIVKAVKWDGCFYSTEVLIKKKKRNTKESQYQLKEEYENQKASIRIHQSFKFQFSFRKS